MGRNRTNFAQIALPYGKIEVFLHGKKIARQRNEPYKTQIHPDPAGGLPRLFRPCFRKRGRTRRLARQHPDPAWELDYIEGDLNYNTGRNREALKHYNAALESRHAKGNDTLRMELLHRLISCYDGLHDEVNKMRCTGQLMELAKKLGDKPMESIALFNMGKSLHYQGDKKRGYRYMEQGAEMMAATDYRLKYDNLRYEYKTLVMFYERDGLYDEVLRILDAWEKIVSASTGGEPAIDGLDESERKDLCAMRTVALSRLGRKAEAAECYRRFCALDKSLSRNNYLIMPYLFDTKQYDEIFRINLPRERFLISRKDTVNYYMASVLKFLGYAYRDVGDYDKSSVYFERLAVLRDSLKCREQESAAQDYAALYDSKEKDRQILQEQQESRTAWTIAGGIKREISLKNETLTDSLNEMTEFRKAFFRKQEEVIALQEQVEQLTSRLPPEEKPEAEAKATDADAEALTVPDAKPEQDYTENDRRLFDRIQYEIEKRELFLLKDFDKEAFAKEMNISPRKLGRLFIVFAKKNLSDYLHGLRLPYALTLLHEYPNWTMEAVAEKCGLSLRTFHRLFTKKYGITPQAYREKSLKKEEQNKADNQ